MNVQQAIDDFVTAYTIEHNLQHETKVTMRGRLTGTYRPYLEMPVDRLTPEITRAALEIYEPTVSRNTRANGRIIKGQRTDNPS